MKISIITTVYNIENYIKKCLESLLAQTYKNLEIIIVDDCGEDNSMKIVESISDERIKIIHHSENLGAGQARKTGIEAATGDYIITIDGDDWISPTFIEDLVNNAKETNADIVSGGITIVYNNEYEEVKRFIPTISTGFKKFLDYNNRKIIFLANKLVRRELYQKVPYSIRRYCEDTPVILPLLYYANMVSYVDNQGYYYRQHDSSLCHRVNLFEQSLFKGLCCKDMVEFFSDKEEEYKGLINMNEYFSYIKDLKTYGNKEMYNKYTKELGELMPILLNLIK